MVLTVTVEHHLPVTALFNYPCLSGDGCAFQFTVIQVRTISKQNHPIGGSLCSDWISEKKKTIIREWKAGAAISSCWLRLGMCRVRRKLRQITGAFIHTDPLQFIYLYKHVPLKGNWKESNKTSTVLSTVKGLHWFVNPVVLFPQEKLILPNVLW